MTWNKQARRAFNAMRTRRQRRGFTLIELLVVLVILALLAGIVLPKFLGANKEAQVKAAKTQISSFNQAIKLYMLDHSNKAPDTLADLIQSDNGKKYLDNTASIPKDPWGNEYIYEPDGADGEPLIKSLGADGKDQGTGVDADISNIEGTSNG